MQVGNALLEGGKGGRGGGRLPQLQRAVVADRSSIRAHVKLGGKWHVVGTAGDDCPGGAYG